MCLGSGEAGTELGATEEVLNIGEFVAHRDDKTRNNWYDMVHTSVPIAKRVATPIVTAGTLSNGREMEHRSGWAWSVSKHRQTVQAGHLVYCGFCPPWYS
jgi:hypothetical protein